MTGLCPQKAKHWQPSCDNFPVSKQASVPWAGVDRAETHCQRLTVAEENGLHLQKVVQIRKQRPRLLRSLLAPQAMHLMPSSPFYSEDQSVCLVENKDHLLSPNRVEDAHHACIRDGSCTLWVP